MQEVGQRPVSFQFGVFELNPHTRELRKHGTKVKLQDQPLQILLLLLDHPGEVVTRQDIQKRLWPESTYVDFDNAINSAVRKLRDALGDAADNPRFIETLSRRGYRFIAPVSAPPALEVVRNPVRDLSKPHSPIYNWRWWAFAAALVFIIVGGVLYKTYFEQTPATADTLPPPIPLTSYPGFQWSPSLSPDGTRVAFTWEAADKRSPSIYAKLIGPSDPVRLTTGGERDFAPAWSPDGRWIAFLRVKGPFTCAVMLIPSLGGGGVREVALVQLDPSSLYFYGWGNASSPFLAWSSDGKWLLALEQSRTLGLAPESRLRIVRISIASGEKSPFLLSLNTDQKASEEIPLNAGEESLSVSPDGKRLAFVHRIDHPNTDIFVVPLTDEMLPAGPATSLHFAKSLCVGIAWDADGRSLIVSSNRRGSFELWRLPVSPPGKPSRIDISDDLPLSPAVSKVGQHLVYTHFISDWNIWRADLMDGRVKNAAAFITSSKDEYRASYSADGKRIAFESNRSGNYNEVWVSDASGMGAAQLTFGNSWSGSPTWSPDGQRIAFDGQAAEDRWGIYLISAQGGQPIRFTSAPGAQIRPSWSHDGQWIYYCASSDTGPQIWKKGARGGPEIQVTRHGGCNQQESPDGRYLYYLNKDNSALWRVSVHGAGDEEELVQLEPEAQFALGNRGVYFIESMFATTLKLLDYKTRSIKVIGSLRGPMIHGMTVSPDDHWLLYAMSESAGSRLMLVDNFP
jgi:Tol biopolymer transport system component/DNA-binding winged helix-turn-helix (wHTH) protein